MSVVYHWILYCLQLTSVSQHVSHLKHQIIKEEFPTEKVIFSCTIIIRQTGFGVQLYYTISV